MTGLEIAWGAVGQDASRLQGHSEDYEAAVQRLKERGNGASAWGDVGLIGMFASAYAECSQFGVEALSGLSEVISGTGDGLRTAARNASEADAASMYGTT
ncbi:hypothetical protein AB0L53_06220 [Nonomuraea sp. NPDC052129]|uniref:hypothetical protein n=1 Tax=Nonomuraea sp. NPDC052129 TaxID=3154651 RepID=UPI003437603F